MWHTWKTIYLFIAANSSRLPVSYPLLRTTARAQCVSQGRHGTGSDSCCRAAHMGPTSISTAPGECPGLHSLLKSVFSVLWSQRSRRMCWPLGTFYDHWTLPSPGHALMCSTIIGLFCLRGFCNCWTMHECCLLVAMQGSFCTKNPMNTTSFQMSFVRYKL